MNKNISDQLMEFIDETPNAYSCVENVKNELLINDYIELKEDEAWDSDRNNETSLKTYINEGYNRFFVVRNDSSIIAFKTDCDEDYENTNNGFNITAVHSDSPSFSIKPNPDIKENGYLKLNTYSYGGMINYTWFDRPLSIGGRVVLEKNGEFENKIINIDKDLLIIPSQAIHINREVNEQFTANRQIDMLPIAYLGKNITLEDLLMEQFNKRIIDYDLYLYNRDKAKYCGINNEFILSPRLDDLACLYPALQAFIGSEDNSSINVFCAFNNEEIGSLKQQGADSTFLIDTLTRITKSLNMNLFTSLANSVLVSADNAHAVHPNAAGKSDINNKDYLNKGIVIKKHTNYTTDAVSSAIFKKICENAKVPYQEFTCRSDMACGATLGGVGIRHLGVNAVDIGLAQLAMHSANETMGSLDPMYMYSSLLEFYSSNIKKENGNIKIKRKANS